MADAVVVDSLAVSFARGDEEIVDVGRVAAGVDSSVFEWIGDVFASADASVIVVVEPGTAGTDGVAAAGERQPADGAPTTRGRWRSLAELA